MKRLLRVSSYIIPVQITEKKYLLLHGYRGSIDVLDKDIYEKYIKMFDETKDKELDVIEFLQQRGYLTTLTHFEEIEYVNKFAILLHRKARLLLSSYTFAVTYNCNFRCPYCFEKKAMEGKSLRDFTMKNKTVDWAFDAIDKIQEEKLVKTNFITLFGGEPLLAQNKEIVSYIATQGVKRGFKFKAITNGYDLNNFLDFLSPDCICSVQITLDGIEGIHNLKRPHYLGIPTFQTIVSNIGMALKKNVFVTIRTNVDSENFQQTGLLKDFFNKIGYTRYPKFAIESARLINYDMSISAEDKKKFLSQREFIKKHSATKSDYYCQDFGAFNNVFKAIKNKKPLPYKSIFCGSQIGGYVFDPLCNIYPCWDMVGKKEFVIGNYFEGRLVWNKEKRQEWLSSDITTDNRCKICKCALLCGGGCHARRPNQCTEMIEILRYAAKLAYNNYLITKK